MHPTLFRSLVWALQYLTFTRLDITYVVNYACQFMSHPTDVHFSLVKRIIRYLQGIMECGLTSPCTPTLDLMAYSDVNWASDINTR